MLVYVIVFGIAVGMAGLAQYGHCPPGPGDRPRSASIAALLVAGILAGVSALRWRVGTDYWSYDRLFPIYAMEAAEGFSLLGEPGLRAIAWVSMAINGDSATMFAIAAVVTVGLSVRTLWRWSPAFAFSIAIYILAGAWHGSFNGIRQYLACAVVFAGHRYIIERRLGRWVLIVIAAMLFHLSAIVALLLYFVPTKRTSLAIQFSVIALGLVGMLTYESLLGFLAVQTGETQQWAGSYAGETLNPLRVAFALMPIALFWLLRNRDAIADSRSWFYVNMLAVYGATYLASAGSALLARFAIYALPFIAIGLTSVTAVANVKDRIIIRAAVLGVYAAFMYVEISGVDNLREFQWIWERP